MLHQERKQLANEGWYWDGGADRADILWGGCVESLLLQVAVEK